MTQKQLSRLVHYFAFNTIDPNISLLNPRAKYPENPYDALFSPFTAFRFPDFDFDDLRFPANHSPVCSILFFII